MNINEMKEKILLGQTTLRKLSKETGIGRDKLKRMIEKACSSEELNKLNDALANNKANSATLKIDGSLKEAVIKILKGEISVREASETYGFDRETLTEKATKLAESFPEYEEYKGKRGDYSGMNFRYIIIDMIENGWSQTECAVEYGISPRTISREIEKLGKSDDPKDQQLYDIAKAYSEKKMKRQQLSNKEKALYENLIEQMKEDAKYTTLELESDTDKKAKELKEFKKKVLELKAQGKTNEQIAQELGVSVSTLRRKTKKLSLLNPGENSGENQTKNPNNVKSEDFTIDD